MSEGDLMNLGCRASLCKALSAPGMMLVIPFAMVEPSNAQTGLGGLVLEWGISGSIPQTGSTAHTSGEAFTRSRGEETAQSGIAPAEVDAGASLPGPEPEGLEAAAPPASKLLVVIDKSSQKMTVHFDKVEQYSWKVSTGRSGYVTPSGSYTASSMNEIWYSKEWDSAPMPHAIFFTKNGHAIHATYETKKLGRPASHGCVRLAPENARTLFALVEQKGLANTEIVLKGDTPGGETKVATPGFGPKQAKRSKSRAAYSIGRPELEPTRRVARKGWFQRRLNKPAQDLYPVGTARR